MCLKIPILECVEVNRGSSFSSVANGNSVQGGSRVSDAVTSIYQGVEKGAVPHSASVVPGGSVDIDCDEDGRE